MASQVKDAAWLEWLTSLMGAGSRQTYTATLPPDRFHCLLDELPLHLIPQPYLDHEVWRQKESTASPLVLNPQCSLLMSGLVPQELEAYRYLLDGFHLQGLIAWVRDPVLNTSQPFWLGPRLEIAIREIQQGEASATSIASDIQFLLTAAGILISERESERRRTQWGEALKKGAQQFREKGYAPLSGLVHPFHIAALRRYYRRAIRRGSIRLGDAQSSRRYVAHNETVARFFHFQIANAVTAIVGETVKPSYVYLASYLSGAELKKHIDREQCEFSVTLCLDFSPEPKLATPWPICMDTGAGKVAVYQGLGDGLVYRGTKVPHYRAALAEGHTSTSIFFHYVPEDFKGSLI